MQLRRLLIDSIEKDNRMIIRVDTPPCRVQLATEHCPWSLVDIPEPDLTFPMTWLSSYQWLAPPITSPIQESEGRKGGVGLGDHSRAGPILILTLILCAFAPTFGWLWYAGVISIAGLDPLVPEGVHTVAVLPSTEAPGAVAVLVLRDAESVAFLEV